MPLVRPVTHRAIRSFPKGFCPSDLQRVRLFYAPLQRDLVAGAIGDPTFSRATTATYIDQDTGFITGAASGEARFEANGYLSEGQRTNLLLQSNDFDTTWSAAATPGLAQDVVGVDGTTSAWTITDNDAAQREGVAQIVTVADDNLTHVFSFYVKKTTSAASFPGVDMQLTGGSTLNAFYTLNTDDGTSTQRSAVSDDGAITAGELLGDFWRYEVTLANDTSGATALECALYAAVNTDAGDTWANATTGTAVFTDSQLEKATFAASYIPTVASAVTRNQDVLTWAGAGNILTASGTIYGEFDTANIATAQTFIDTRDGSDEQGVFLAMQADADPEADVFTGTSQAPLVTTADDFVANTLKTMALTWQADDVELYTDGVSRDTDTTATMPSSHTVIRIGTQGAGGQPLFGHVRNVQVFGPVLEPFDVARIR